MTDYTMGLVSTPMVPAAPGGGAQMGNILLGQHIAELETLKRDPLIKAMLAFKETRGDYDSATAMITFLRKLGECTTLTSDMKECLAACCRLFSKIALKDSP